MKIIDCKELGFHAGLVMQIGKMDPKAACALSIVRDRMGPKAKRAYEKGLYEGIATDYVPDPNEAARALVNMLGDFI